MGIIKNTFTLKLASILIGFVFVVGYGFNAFAQSVPLTSYTVQPTNATCTSNGVITINVPVLTGGSTYNGTWTAQITRVGSKSVAQNVSSVGGDVVFSSLLPGDYNVLVTDGTTTLTYASNPVKITTSYVTMNVTSSSVAPSCASTQDGTLTVNVANGVGPFIYTVTSNFGTQTFSTASRSQTFGNMQAGETVSITVTDLVNNQVGCSTSVNTTRTIASPTLEPIGFNARPYNFERDCSSIPGSCSGVKFYVNLSNVSNTRLTALQNGGAKITIAGTTYDLTFSSISGTNARFTYDPVITGGPVLINGTFITTTFQDGCSTLTRDGTVRMNDNFLTLQATTTTDNTTCEKKYRVLVIGDQDITQNGFTDRAVYFCETNTLTIEKRDANNVYQPVTVVDPDPSLSTNDLGVSLNRPIPSAVRAYFVDGPGVYRFTASDACRTTAVVREITVVENNPLGIVTLQEENSVIAGTSTIKVNFPGVPPLSSPLNIVVNRVDGQSSITIPASNPGSLSGSYTYNFPMNISYAAYPTPEMFIGDLPLGEYDVTITDQCGVNTITRRINLVKAAAYTPSITVTEACVNSNSVSYNMNPVNALNVNITAQLYKKSSTGALTLVANNYGALSGSFNSLASGDYVIRFVNVRYVDQTVPERTYSAAFGDFRYQTYDIEFTVPPFKDFTVDTSIAFCSIADPNSGIVSAQITDGTIVYPVSFTLYETSNSTTPLRPIVTVASGDLNAVFQNIPVGNYFVRVATACSSKDVAVSVTTTTTIPQAKVSDAAVCPGSPTTLAAISATNNLYDIVWEIKNADGTFSPALGSDGIQLKGMPVPLTPTVTTTYRAVFSLRSTFGCSNNTTYYSEVEVKVTPNPDLETPKVSNIDLCKNPNPTVTISNSELGFIYEILTPQGASFSPNITGIGNGANLVLSVPANQLTVGSSLKVSSTNGNAGCNGYLQDEISVTASTANLALDVEGSYVCSGSSGTIKVKAAEAGLTYTVLKNGAVLNPSLSATGAGVDLSFTIPTTELTAASNEFTIKVSGAGCANGILTETAIITVQQAPSASTSIHAICGVNGGKGTIEVSTFGGSGDYEYSLDNSNWQAASTFSVNPGSYTVYAKDKVSGCISSSSVTIGLYCLELTKTSTTNPNNFDAVGDVLTYDIVVKNTGNLPLSSIIVSDPQASLSASTISSLAAGASATVSASYTVTQADLNQGSFTNSASAKAVYNNTDIQDGDDETINAIQNPAISLVKTADKQTYVLGHLITYTFEVENTGNVTLSNVSVSDPMVGLSAVIPTSVATLVPGAKTRFTATYTATQADVDAGTIVNTATASAKFGSTDVTDTSTETISVSYQSPAISLVKTSDKQTYALGDVITYTFEVENTGNVTLSNVSVADPMVGLSAVSPTSVATLAPGAKATFTATYTATQADVDASKIMNTATVNAEFGTTIVNDSSTKTVSNIPNPSLTISKTSTSVSYNAEGQVLNYSIVVTNDGNVTLSNIDVKDPLTGLNQIIGTLAPNGSQTFSTSYTVKYSDLAEKEIENTAKATFTYGAQSFEESDVIAVPNAYSINGINCGANSYAIGNGIATDILVKVPYTGGVAASYSQGQAINLGNGDLTATLQAGTINPVGGELVYRVVGTPANATTIKLPINFGGEKCELNIFIYEPTQTTQTFFVYPFNDKNNNCIKDSGEGADGIPEEGLFIKVFDLDDNMLYSSEITYGQFDVVDLNMDSDRIYYYIIDTNEDGTDITPGLTKGWNSGMAAPNLKRYFQFDGTNIITNTTANANLADPTWENVFPLRVCMNQDPGEIDELDCSNTVFNDLIQINKDTNGLNFKINYTGGNGGYYNAQELSSIGISGLKANLAAGSFADGSGTLTFTLTGTPLSAGIGKFELNIGGQSCELQFSVEEPQFSISKEALDLKYVKQGDEVDFKITVINTGKVTLSNILVKDPLTGLNETVSSLAPNEIKIYTTTYLVTQADVNAGKVENTASAEFSFNGVDYKKEAKASSTLDQSGKNISVSVEAIDFTFDYAGDKLKVLYKVENSGTVSLFNVLVKDETTGFEKTVAKLEPGEIVEFTEILYTITNQDFELGFKEYEVSAVAYTLNGDKAEDLDYDEALKRIIQTIDVRVTANTKVISKVGQVIIYTYEVINTGNTDIGKVIVKDPKTGLDVILDELLYKEVKVITKEYVVTQADLDRGFIENTVTAEILIYANSSIDGTKAIDDELVTSQQEAALIITKDSDLQGFRLAGEIINYTIKISNTGNVSLENITVKDPLTGMLENILNLAPGESKVFSTQYSVAKNDKLIGAINNTATVEFSYSGTGYSVNASKKIDYLGFLHTLEAKDDNFQDKPVQVLKSGFVGNVLTNDLKDGKAVKSDEVLITVLDNAGISGLTIDNNGNLNIPSDTPAGTYSVKYSICDLVDTDNCSEAIVTFKVIRGVNLRIFKELISEVEAEGDSFDYTLRVENNGTTTATNVVVTDLIPSGLTYVNSSVKDANAETTVFGDELKWTIASLDPGKSFVITLRVKSLPLSSGREKIITNTAKVSSLESELSPSDNSSSVSVLIEPFFIPNMITPNGDGYNDQLVIKGLTRFVNTELVILNRWGDHVYKSSNYKNDWSAKGLVAGTYFYVFTGVDKQGKRHDFKGWIQLIQE